MRISDIVSLPEFNTQVLAEGPPGTMARTFNWAVPTESIDPTEYLTPGTLVLTSGSAMNVSDHRVWDAYVERLVSVPIAALLFGVGPAHPTAPEGLVGACKTYGLPLLVVPAEVPFPLVQRDLQDRVSTERYEAIRRGSELAQECTKLVAAGGTLEALLHHLAANIGERVLIEDRTGAELVRAGGPGPFAERAEFHLPAPDDNAFRLVVEVSQTTQLLTSLVRPTTAVLAMQLAATLGSATTTHSRNTGRLIEAISTRSAIETEELLTLTQEAELDPYQPIGIFLLRVKDSMSITYLRTLSWRTRGRLATVYPTMRFVEDTELSTMLVQGENLNQRQLHEIIADTIGGSPAFSALVDVVENSAELGLALRHMRRCLGEQGVVLAPPMNFDSLVDTLKHPGTVSMAQRLLAPLAAPEQQPLRETLSAYLRYSGAKNAICEELFIHRNTLSYRLKKIEKALDTNLQDGQTRAVLLLALRLA